MRVIRGSSVILKKPSVSLRSRERRLALLGVGDHRAELEHAEAAAVAADAELAEEDRARRVEPDRERDDRDDRREREQRQECDQHVERSLDGAGARREPEAAQAEHRHAVDVLEVDGGADDLEHPREQAHAHADRLRDADQLERLAVVGRGRGEDHAVDVVLEHEREQAEVAVEGVRRLARGQRQRGHDLGAGPAGVDLAAHVGGELGVADHEAALGAHRAARTARAGGRAREDEREAEDQPQHDEHVGLERLAADHGGGDRRQGGELEQHRGLVERRAAQHEVVAVVEVAGLERQHGGERDEQVDGREREAAASRRPAARTRRRGRRRRRARGGSGARARDAGSGWPSGIAAGP